MLLTKWISYNTSILVPKLSQVLVAVNDSINYQGNLGVASVPIIINKIAFYNLLPKHKVSEDQSGTSAFPLKAMN